MLQSGQEFAQRFRLIRRLGGSDAAPVWLASDRADSGNVALKFLPLEPGAAAAQSALAARLRPLQHPGLMLPREWPELDGRTALVMPYADAGTLAERRGQAPAVWLSAAVMVARALQYLHAQGLVHGDVKAANVLLDANGQAQLGDLELLLPIGAARAPAARVSAQSASPAQRRAEPAATADDVYAFGAMLHELLTGQPPALALGEDLAGIKPVHPAPETLLRLTQRCLHSEAGARPADMGEVVAELESLSAAPEGAPVRPVAPILTPPSTPASALRPQWQRAAGVAAADPRQARRQGFRQGLMVAVGVLLALLAVLTFVLPARKAVVASGGKVPMAAPPAPRAEAAPEPVADLQALARDKTAAEELRTSVGGALKTLFDADAASWNPAAAAEAERALAAVDRLMEQRDYRGAQAGLRALAPLANTLEGGRAPALKAALERGQAALAQHDAVAATAAFAAALRIDATSAAAQQGAKRAANLEPLLAAIARARTLEQAGKTGDAARAWREALALDGAAPEAQAGVARTGAQLSADQFGQLMARAYAAVAAHRGSEAREAFAAAARMRPDDPEIARGLAQLAADENAATLGTELTAARAAMAREQWPEAVTHLQKVLALDGTLVEARQGLAQASARAQLQRELQLLIDQPERAYTPQVHEAGKASLERARAVAAPGPVLSAQIVKVAELLQLADTPVSVALRSDNQTQVTVYRVGALGAFAERAMQLRPGRYVAVGTRSGYRDVRREFFIAAGKPAETIDIRCSERI